MTYLPSNYSDCHAQPITRYRFFTGRMPERAVATRLAAFAGTGAWQMTLAVAGADAAAACGVGAADCAQ